MCLGFRESKREGERKHKPAEVLPRTGWETKTAACLENPYDRTVNVLGGVLSWADDKGGIPFGPGGAGPYRAEELELCMFCRDALHRVRYGPRAWGPTEGSTLGLSSIRRDTGPCVRFRLGRGKTEV